MNLKDMQTDLEMVAVQEFRFDYHPFYSYPVIYTKHGWKNAKTGEITWEKVNIEPLGRAQNK